MGPRASPQVTTTLALILGLLVAFSWASYLAYWGGVDVSDAFAYQSDVVAAQRDVELLKDERDDKMVPPQELQTYEKLLDNDLAAIDRDAASADERAPSYQLPPTENADEQLEARLAQLSRLGAQRFQRTVRHNTETRDISNALFGRVALIMQKQPGR